MIPSFSSASIDNASMQARERISGMGGSVLFRFLDRLGAHAFCCKMTSPAAPGVSGMTVDVAQVDAEYRD